MRSMLAAALFGVVLAVGATASAQEEGPGAKEPVAVVPAAQDSDIAKRLSRILQSTEWFKAARVGVRDGVVTLDGKTDSVEHQQWAGDLAQKTEGTVAVVNRIEIEADVGSTFGRAGEEFARLYRQVVQSWPVVALAAVILIITWIAAKLVAAISRRMLASRIESPLLLLVVARAFAIPIFLLGIYFVLQAAGLTRLALTVLGGTGLAGIVIGFAFRDIAENFLASILLSARNPFRSGDLIEVAGHTGIVQNLNTRSSVLLTLDGNHVQIPNATVYKSTIKNYSSIPSRRAEYMVGIGYDSSTAKAQLLIADVLRKHPAVLDAPEPLVLVNALGAATVDLQIFYWFDSATYSPAKINSALLRLSKNALLEGGIELPDAAREVVFPKGVPVVQADSAQHLESARRTPAAPASSEETSAVTTSEGELTNESADVCERSTGGVPEAEENLLKD
jgi:small conductance mechanosensitive channel